MNDELELETLVSKTGYNRNKFLSCLNKIGESSNYSIKKIIKNIEIISVKRILLKKLRRELNQEKKFGICKTNYQIMQLIDLLTKKDQFEISYLSRTLNLSNESLKLLLKELEKLGEKGLIKYGYSEEETEVIIKLNKDN